MLFSPRLSKDWRESGHLKFSQEEEITNEDEGWGGNADIKVRARARARPVRRSITAPAPRDRFGVERPGVRVVGVGGGRQIMCEAAFPF